MGREVGWFFQDFDTLIWEFFGGEGGGFLGVRFEGWGLRGLMKEQKEKKTRDCFSIER